MIVFGLHITQNAGLFTISLMSIIGNVLKNHLKLLLLGVLNETLVSKT